MKKLDFRLLFLFLGIIFIVILLSIKSNFKKTSKNNTENRVLYLSLEASGMKLGNPDSKNKIIFYFEPSDKNIPKFREMLKEFMKIKGKEVFLESKVILDDYESEKKEFISSIFCISDQNLFWEFFDLLGPEKTLDSVFYDLKGLDQEKYNKCRSDQNKIENFIQEAISNSEYTSLSVFLNGKFVEWTEILFVPLLDEEIKVTKPEVFIGDINSPIEVIEYIDYSSRISKLMHERVMKFFEENLGKVRVIFRNFPNRELYPNTIYASEALYCANLQGKFLEFQKELFRMNSNSSFSKDRLVLVSEKLGLDIDQFSKCVYGRFFTDFIIEEFNSAFEYKNDLDPFILLNGKVISKLDDLYDEFSKVMEESKIN